MQTLTAEQFKAKYGSAGAGSFGVQEPSNEPSYTSRITNRVSGDLAKRIDTTSGILNKKDVGTIEKGVQLFGQGAGLASNILETAVTEIPGVKQVVEGVGEGIKWLATSELSPIKHLGDVIGSNKTLQEITHLYDTDSNFRDTVDAVGNSVRLGADVSTILNSANFAANVTNKVIGGVKDTTSAMSEAVQPSINKIQGGGKKILNETFAPANIMNRVARLNPLDENKFVKLSGQTPGEYLTKTGNFGPPEKIIANEATKFVKSIQSVDEAFKSLPGVYKNGAIEDALNGLAKKAESVSSPNVPAPFKSEVDALLTKYNETGLNMEEINQVKRLYERNVKLGYNKLLNADEVAKATNIDSNIRTFQLKTANDLGFTNADKLNNQTQISRFIVDKLGAKIIGQSGNNALGLTDWVILAGGNPQAIAGFLTKKFFSSKSVQSRIAKMISGDDVNGQITPQISITSENINRRINPTGSLGLPSGEGRIRSQITGSGVIPVAPKGTNNMEFTGKTGVIPSKQISQQLSRKSQLTSQENIKTNPSNTAPTTKTSSRTIEPSVPQKKSIIQRAVDKYKEIPNKEGGFVRIGGKVFKEIDEATKKELIRVSDYLNLSKEVDPKIEYMIEKLFPKYNINQDWTVPKMLDVIEKLVENTKTR